jgi:hypothetical protein
VPDDTATPQKPKRIRKPKEPTGPVQPREMTQIRDEVDAIRRLAQENPNVPPPVIERLIKLHTRIDRLDLRFKLNHDPSTKKKG